MCISSETTLQYDSIMMKTFILTSLLVALAYGSPLLVERQSCPASGISAARPAQVFSKFIPTRVIPDSVPELTPTTDLRIKYGNMNEDLDNEFTILRESILRICALVTCPDIFRKHLRRPSSHSTQTPASTQPLRPGSPICISDLPPVA
jgi:hypothetical protein